MVQFIDRGPRKPSFLEELGHNLGSGISEGMNQSRQFAQQMKLQEARKKEEQKDMKEAALQSTKQSIDTLRELASRSGVGMVGQFNPSAEGRRNRGEFEATSSSLLPLFKTLFPRGFTEREFKIILDKYVPAVGDTQEKIMGKLDGLENLIDSLSSGKTVDLEGSLSDTGREGSSEKFLKMRDPSGALRKVSSKDVKAARKAGYQVIK